MMKRLTTTIKTKHYKLKQPELTQTAIDKLGAFEDFEEKWRVDLRYVGAILKFYEASTLYSEELLLKLYSGEELNEEEKQYIERIKK